MKIAEKSILAVAMTMVAIGLPSQSNADWQYTKWGMSPAQVVLASNGTASQGKGSNGERITGYETAAVGTYVSGQYHFRSTFHFKQNRLALINLNLVGANLGRCADLRNDLEGVYGKPYENSDDELGTAITWHDEKNNNLIAMFIIKVRPELCAINYSALVTPGGKGL